LNRNAGGIDATVKIVECLLSSAVVLAAIMAVNGQTALPPNSAAATKTDPPVFDAVALDSIRLNSAALRGKVLVIEFWFTGCEPCVEDISKLNDLVDQFKERDVVFIAPTWDNEPILRAFLKEHPFKYHIIPNAKDLILRACKDGEGNIVVPVRLVISKEGKIDFTSDGGFSTEKVGQKRYDDLRGAIERAVNAAPTAK
jgi:peroxiredoxin